jgi:hypothetical protein
MLQRLTLGLCVPWAGLPRCYHAPQSATQRASASNHTMTPQAFIAKWGPASSLNEEQGAQSHFLDLCELLGVAKPGSEPGYLFGQGGRVAQAAAPGQP